MSISLFSTIFCFLIFFFFCIGSKIFKLFDIFIFSFSIFNLILSDHSFLYTFFSDITPIHSKLCKRHVRFESFKCYP
uniref:Uncharacterized protein n=1 Tax=Panstrongylus lignarius TaxID=156445 RepID=A0A224Y5C6_9HEMI